jgi:hypothetical protein
VVTTDCAGNVYVSSSFNGTVDFDPGADNTSLTGDAFVAKYSFAGELLWARALAGPGFDHGQGIAVDGAGNVYTTGFFAGTVDFDPGCGVPVWIGPLTATRTSTPIPRTPTTASVCWTSAPPTTIRMPSLRRAAGRTPRPLDERDYPFPVFQTSPGRPPAAYRPWLGNAHRGPLQPQTGPGRSQGTGCVPDGAIIEECHH